MKKVFALALAFLMVGTLSACGGETAQTLPSAEPSAPVPSATPSEAVPTPDVATPEASDVPEESDVPEKTGGVLVAYFSATGNTQGVAQVIADHLGADTYEIVPETPYTDADLNYNDPSSRSTLEMDDPDARPAISGSVEGMENYDVVFLGYPIWWGEAPRIISTFLESYDFTGKTIVPFCTSASSGMGASAKNLQDLTDGADWLDGQRFGESPSTDDVTAWVDGLGLNG